MKFFSFLESDGMKINDYLINEAAEIGNLFLVKYFLEKNQIPKDILMSASKSGNIELIKFILEQEGMISMLKIFNCFYRYLFRLFWISK